MNNDRPDVLARRFLDGDLTSEEEADALRRIAENPEARTLLRFDAALRETAAYSHSQMDPVPAGFTDQVMRRVDALEAERARQKTSISLFDYVNRLGRALLTPRKLTWRPAYAVAAAAVLALAFVLLPLSAPPPPAATEPDPPLNHLEETPLQDREAQVLVRFLFVDEEAASVAVAGDFNHWNPSPLSRKEVDGQQVWTGLVEVPPGEHRYMFVVNDSEWITDPLAPAEEDDGFGNRNAVLTL